MNEQLMMVLRACRCVFRSEEALSDLERVILLQMLDDEIQLLESMETPKPRQDGPPLQIRVQA